MASNKKPSNYSNDELEAYGVWVKSEPQDFTASLAEAASFNADALPYEADFDSDFASGFDDMGMGTAGFDLLEPELHIPEISVDDEFIGGETGSDESSTQMLMKIANELSAIRSELNTLKREFAEIRGEAGAGAGDDSPGEADDTVNEMDNLFSAPVFPTEEEMGFDSGREADEAALRELEEQNETETEEIHIDFDNLGIDLDGVAGVEEPQEELPPLEGLTDDDDFEMPSFDPLSFEEAPPAEPDELEEAEQGFAEELVPLEEDAELEELRLEGAEPLASPPDNADYLESDPFVNVTAINEEPVEEPVFEDAFGDTLSDESAQPETAAADDLSFDEAGFDLSLDDIAVEEVEEDTEVAEAAAEPLPEIESLDLTDAVIDEPNLSEEIVEPPLEEPVLNDISFEDDIALDMDAFESDVGLEATAEEPAAEEIGTDLELELDAQAEEPVAEEIGTDLELELDAQAEEPVAEEIGTDLELELDAQTEEPAAEEIGTDLELEEVPADDLEIFDLGEDAALETAAEEPVAEEIGTDLELEVQADDLGAIDFGEDIALEAQEEEPAAEEAGADIDLEAIDLGEDLNLDAEADDLGTVDLGEDIALDTQIDDLGTVDFEPEAKDTGKPVVQPAAHNDIISDIDDSVIPEGLEVNAKEADPSLDDDLEAFAGELAIAEDENPADSADQLADEGSEFAAIPPALKTELKNVLSYMDHLLESLPEEKIEEFAQSEYFDKYKKIFKELGLV